MSGFPQCQFSLFESEVNNNTRDKIWHYLELIISQLRHLLISLTNTLNVILVCMQNIDARKLSSDAQQHNRNQAIRLLNKGKSRHEIAEIIDVHYVTVCNWIRRFEQDGISGLAIGQRGRRAGEDRKLTQAQEAKLKQIICDKNPQQMKLPFALWTSGGIQDLVWELWHVRIARRTVSTYLKRWGFTPQKPANKAYEQCSKAVRKWLDEEYPFIKNRAKLFSGQVYWGDETGVRNQCQHARGYAPKGQTPIVKSTAKRLSFNMISAITNQGTVRFMTYDETMTVKVLLKFFKRLIKDAKRKVFLILDNLKVHHAHLVRDWLERHKDEIEVYYLPSYSPEMNPDEYLNGDLKYHIRSAAPARNMSQLKKTVVGHMRKLQKHPERIRSYFKHRDIAYAA